MNQTRLPIYRLMVRVVVWPTAVIAALLVCLAISFAREGGARSVRGAVTDQDGAVLSGATVQIEDTISLNVRSYVTDRAGAYRFYGLSQDVDYLLRAHYGGFWSPIHRLSAFDSRKEAVINLKVNVKER